MRPAATPKSLLGRTAPGNEAPGAKPELLPENTVVPWDKCMQRVLINGLLSHPKDGFAGDRAGVRGLALLSISICDENDRTERIIRFARDAVLGATVHQRIEMFDREQPWRGNLKIQGSR